MKKLITITCCIIVSTFLFFGVTLSVHASEILFQTPTQTLGVGDEFAVTVVLTRPDAQVNAITGDITFDDTTLSVVRVLSANSIVTGWVEAPHVSGNAVVFSGIMPGGYTSVIDATTGKDLPGTIVTIIFRVEQAGVGTLQFTDVHLYGNDGLGTEIPAQSTALRIAFSTEGSGRTVASNDTITPETFTPTIMRDPNLYANKFVVVFATTDKQTGIDFYEVKEGDLEWTRAVSPYLLVDQKIKGIVKVKAVDLAGNYYISTAETPSTSSKSVFLIPLFALFVVCVLVYRAVVRYHKENSTS